MINNMTVAEVSQYLRVSRQTIYMMVRTGSLPHFKVGNKIRFKRADIEALTNTVKVSKPTTSGDHYE